MNGRLRSPKKVVVVPLGCRGAQFGNRCSTWSWMRWWMDRISWGFSHASGRFPLMRYEWVVKVHLILILVTTTSCCLLISWGVCHFREWNGVSITLRVYYLMEVLTPSIVIWAMVGENIVLVAKSVDLSTISHFCLYPHEFNIFFFFFGRM
jgi:hypothetical protein